MKKKIIQKCIRIAIDKNNPVSHPEYGCFHHMSFIIQSNNIIAYGFNRTGEPLKHFGYNSNQKIHSETDAFRRAKTLLNNQKSFEVLNIRLNKNNELRNSRPCSCCYNFLKIMGCRQIYFSVSDGIFSSLRFIK